MADPAVLQAITELGQEYRRCGWHNRLSSLREFYAVVASGGASTPAWTFEHLERMRSIMHLGPQALPIATRCPRCPPPPPGVWNGTRTGLHLDDRWTCCCSNCGSEWVVLVERPGGDHPHRSL
jgi:hypothetical protein